MGLRSAVLDLCLSVVGAGILLALTIPFLPPDVLKAWWVWALVGLVWITIQLGRRRAARQRDDGDARPRRPSP